MDESSPVYQNFKNKMSSMTGRPKMNVTNMKTIFGDGKGRSVVLGKNSSLVRGGGLDNNKLFQLDGSGDLEERVAGNERKITLLKNVLKAQKPFGGKEDEIIKINSTLQNIGNILTTDYANRINEGKLENNLLKNQLDEQRKINAERDLEKVNKNKSKLGSGIGSITSKVTSPITGIFDKLISAAALLGVGIVGNTAIKFWTKLTSEEQNNVVRGLQRTGLVASKGIVNRVVSPFVKAGKFITKPITSRIFKPKNVKPKITTTGGKVVKPGQFLGATETNIDLAAKGSKVKKANIFKKIVDNKAVKKITSSKIGKLVARSSASVLGDFTGYGGIAFDLASAGVRFKAGDPFGGVLSIASAVPVLGWAATAYDVAREFGLFKDTPVIGINRYLNKKNAKELSKNLKKDSNTKVIIQNLEKETEDRRTAKKVFNNDGDVTQVAYVTSTNSANPDMEKTPAIHGILLGDNE